MHPLHAYRAPNPDRSPSNTQTLNPDHSKVVQLLLSAGVDKDRPDARGASPLWIASAKDHDPLKSQKVYVNIWYMLWGIIWVLLNPRKLSVVMSPLVDRTGQGLWVLAKACSRPFGVWILHVRLYVCAGLSRVKGSRGCGLKIYVLGLPI